MTVAKKFALPVLALAAAGLMTACTTVGEPTNTAGSAAASGTAGSSSSGTGTSGSAGSGSSGSGSSGSGSSAGTAAAGLPSGVTPDMAQNLCDDLAGQAQSMRTYTPTIGKVTLNTTVGTWSMKYNLNLVDIAQHPEKIDQVLEAQCPTVRADVISALQIPDIASGLLGT